MDVKEARHILNLGEEYSDEFVQQIIDQTAKIAQIFIEQFRENKLCQKNKNSYNKNGDNNQKGDCVHLEN
ncbi:hypothetical protein JW766_04695 [Candidatus Dojkabacteria bacterium]|nr:hypothetical protein [Candidatus Dojkabacteria bacterium]